MERSYDDRDGFIWLDGEIIPWRKAQVHILTHALHMLVQYLKANVPIMGKYLKVKTILLD